MAEEAWSRWGTDDERGALNLIGAEQVRHAVSLVRRGETVALAQPISAAMMVPPKRPRPSHFMSRDGGDYAAGQRRPGGFQFAEDTVVLPLHAGTHLDCLCHAWYGDKLYNGFAGSDVRSTGSLRCGAEKIGPIVTRGVLLDCVTLNGGPLADGVAIGPDMLRQAMSAQDISLRAGDAVLIRTGWLEAHEQGGSPDFNREPGLDVEAALMLAQAGAALVGADNYAVEVLPFAEGTVFPVHQRLMRDHGVLLLEGLVLAPLAARGVAEFLFMAAPLLIAGATGSPLTPVAVL
jgi:kynurenine formamidase